MRSFALYALLFLIKHTTEPKRRRDAHNRDQIGWSTPPSGLYTKPSPPVLSTSGVYELHTSVSYTSVKVVNTVHTYSIRFKQHASLTKLDKSRYWAFMSICHCCFHSNCDTPPSGVCLCCRAVCRSVRLCRGSPDFEWWWSVPLSSASLYTSFLLFCLIFVYSSQFSISF